MRNLLLRLAAVLIALLPVSSLAADLTAEQREAMDRVVEFYRQMGAMGDKTSGDLADRLQNAIRQKKLSFGTVPDGDNAIADPGTGTIVFKESFVREVNSDADEALTDRAELAATAAHEFQHLDQYSLYVASSKASAAIGQGNPAEQEAWTRGFDRMATWVAQMKTELTRQQKNNERFREQAWTAQQLRFLCNAWRNYRNCYEHKGKEIGEILVVNPADPTGKRVSVEEAFEQIEELREEAIGIARIGEQMAVPFDGHYDGTVGDGYYQRKLVVGIAKGEIHFLIRGTNVDVNVKCTNMVWDVIKQSGLTKNKQDDWFQYKLRGTIDVDGNVNAKTEGSGYSLVIVGNFSNGEGKGIFQPADRTKSPWGVWEVKRREKP